MIKMKPHLKTLSFLTMGAILLFNSCSKNNDDVVDTEKPTVSVNYDNGFPQACSLLQRRHTYTIRARASDNVGLAAYSIDIHNNFDHHTHDNQEAECELAPIKDAVNPFLFMKNYSMENGLSQEIQQEITIPENIDTGDYHFHLSVTDVTGWQSSAYVDVKIIE